MHNIQRHPPPGSRYTRISSEPFVCVSNLSYFIINIYSHPSIRNPSRSSWILRFVYHQRFRVLKIDVKSGIALPVFISFPPNSNLTFSTSIPFSYATYLTKSFTVICNGISCTVRLFPSSFFTNTFLSCRPSYFSRSLEGWSEAALALGLMIATLL